MLTAKVRGYFPCKRGFVMLPESLLSLFLWSLIGALPPLLDVYQILWEGGRSCGLPQTVASWVSARRGKAERGRGRWGRGGGRGLGRGCVSFGVLALEITHCHFFWVLLIDIVTRSVEVLGCLSLGRVSSIYGCIRIPESEGQRMNCKI